MEIFIIWKYYRVYCDYNSTYTVLRERADVPPLYTSRVRNQMIDVFKILIQENGPRCLRTLFTEYEHSYDTRSIRSLDLPKYRTVNYPINFPTINLPTVGRVNSRKVNNR